MGTTADKARFYLEQYVPELQEYARKELFSRDEITAITAKRSDFEHILNARGSTPGDYARYATYEMNLDALRKRRCKRLGIKTTTFNGQRTVFFILDRATKKFSGDAGLWIQYIRYCQKEKANKKLSKVFTSVLRLKPKDWQMWVLAAKHYAETQGDMGTARSYMQRGLRFCKDEGRLYLQYCKMEMVYLAKLAARRKILGLDDVREEEANGVFGEEADVVKFALTAEDLDPDAGKGIEEFNADALQKMADAPAFSGAIPIAIFDAAMKQVSQRTPGLAEDFFDMVVTFKGVPSTNRILQHIITSMEEEAFDSLEIAICNAKFCLFAVDIQSHEFPAALGKALAFVKSGLAEIPTKQSSQLAEKAIGVLLPYLVSSTNLDEDIIKVLEASAKRYIRVIAENSGSTAGAKLKALSEHLADEEREAYAATIERLAIQVGLG